MFDEGFCMQKDLVSYQICGSPFIGASERKVPDVFNRASMLSAIAVTRLRPRTSSVQLK